MDTLENITKILRNEMSFLKNTYNITRLGIFGSWVRNEQTQNSDVDILFDYDNEYPLSIFNIIDIKEYLSQKLNQNVDLIPFNSLKKENIKKNILNEVRFL